VPTIPFYWICRGGWLVLCRLVWVRGSRLTRRELLRGGGRPIDISVLLVRVEERTYVDEGILSLDSCKKFVFREADVQIPSLEVRGYGHCDIDIFDCLGPFVWQSSLFGIFLGLSLGVELLLFFGGW
jgi:hypothetical protein